MKKRFLSILLAAAVLLGILPSAALADAGLTGANSLPGGGAAGAALLTDANILLQSPVYPHPFSTEGVSRFTGTGSQEDIHFGDFTAQGWYTSTDKAGYDEATPNPWTYDPATNTFTGTNHGAVYSYASMSYSFMGEGTISFDWTVKTEGEDPSYGIYDGFIVIMDDTVVICRGSAPNEADVVSGTKSVTATGDGLHTIAWIYTNDAGYSAEGDYATVSNIAFTRADGAAAEPASGSVRMSCGENAITDSGDVLSYSYDEVGTAVSLAVTDKGNAQYTIYVDGREAAAENDVLTIKEPEFDTTENLNVEVVFAEPGKVTRIWKGSTNVTVPTFSMEDLLPEGVTLTNDSAYPWAVVKNAIVSTNTGTDQTNTTATLVLTVPAGVRWASLDVQHRGGMKGWGTAQYWNTNPLTTSGYETTELVASGSPNGYFIYGNTAGFVTKYFEFEDISHANTITVQYFRGGVDSGVETLQAKVKNITLYTEKPEIFGTTAEDLAKGFDQAWLTDSIKDSITNTGSGKWYYDAKADAICNGNPRADGGATTSSFSFTVPAGTDRIYWNEYFNRFETTCLKVYVDGALALDDDINDDYLEGDYSSFNDFDQRDSYDQGRLMERGFQIADASTAHEITFTVTTEKTKSDEYNESFFNTYWISGITAKKLMLPEYFTLEHGEERTGITGYRNAILIPGDDLNTALIIGRDFAGQDFTVTVDGRTIAPASGDASTLRYDLGNVTTTVQAVVTAHAEGWMDSDPIYVTVAPDFRDRLTGGAANITVDQMMDQDYYWTYNSTYSTQGRQAFTPNNQGAGSTVCYIKFSVTGSGTLSFDYMASSEANWDYPVYAIGSMPDSYGNYVQISGGGLEDWTGYSIPVTAASESAQTDVYIGYRKDGSGDSNDDTVAIANVRFVQGQKTLTLVNSNSSFGDISGANPGPNTVQAGAAVALTATPKNGGQFYGWQDGSGKLVSRDPHYTPIITSDLTLTAVFDAAGKYVALSDTGFYETFAAAFAAAGDPVYPAGDVTITENVIVPAGRTLLIPLSAADTSGYKQIGSATREAWNAGYSAYQTLTIPAGKSLTVNGNLILGGTQHANDQGGQGRTSGAYSRIINEGEILLGSGSTATIRGLVTGSGTVTLKNGATGYIPFVTLDYAGGSNTYNLYYAPEFPFHQYATNNIQCPFVIEGGSDLYGLTSLYFYSSVTTETIDLIRQNTGLINLPVGSTVTATYDASKAITAASGSNVNLADYGKTTLTIDGDAQAGRFAIEDFSSTEEGMFLAIPYTYDLVQNSGTLTMDYSYRIMPGASLIIRENAALNVTGALQVVEGWHTLEKSGKRYPAMAGLQSAGMKAVGQLIVDGTLQVSGGLAGIVQATGQGGKIVLDAGATLGGSFRAGSTGYYTDDAVRYTLPARLMDAETGTLSEMEAGTTYLTTGTDPWSLSETVTFTQSNNTPLNYNVSESATGLWGSRVTVHFDPNGGRGEMDDQVFPFLEKQTLLFNDFTNLGYDFAGWNTALDGSGDSFEDEMNDLAFDARYGTSLTLYAQWTPAEYTPEWTWTGDGDEPQVSLTLRYGPEGAMQIPAGDVTVTEVEGSRTGATCQTPGSVTFRASYTLVETYADEHTYEIALTPHTLVRHDGVAADCERDGTITHWTCEVCGKYFADALGETEITQPATVIPARGHAWNEGEITTPPTCVDAGEKTYTCQNDPSHTYTEPIPATGHSYAQPVWAWNDDHTEATATFTCGSCSEETDGHEIVLTATGEAISVTTTEASHLIDGQTVYTATVTLNGKTFTNTATVILTAEGHIYGEPTWSWSADFTEATATFTCREGDDTQTVTTTEITGEERTPATCTAEGTMEYTATVTFLEVSYSSTTTGPIPKIAHNLTHPDPVPATCTATGLREYWYCEACGQYFIDEGTTVVTYEDLITEKIPHSYGDPAWTWTGYDSATATFTCAACGDTQILDAEVTSEVTTQPTASQPGVRTYTATVTFEGTVYTDEKTEDLPPTGYQVTFTNRVGSLTPATLSLSDGLFLGETTFQVTCTNACTVGYTTDGGERYVTLAATPVEDAENTYAFTVDVQSETEIIIVLKGDVDGNGKLTSNDSSLINRHIVKTAAHKALTVYQQLMADVNGDGKITSTDSSLINRAIVKTAAHKKLDW